MSQKMFDNGLVAIRKSKVTLMLKKPTYVWMCILDLSRLLMYEFHYDYIKNKYGNNSRLLFTDTDSWINEIKTKELKKLWIKIKDAHEAFSKDKEMFGSSNYSAKSKYYDNSNKLVAGKMKDEADGIVIEEFVGLKPKMYSFLVGCCSEHKKEKKTNKNIVAKISHDEHKNVLLNQKCSRHLMNRIQSKNHRIRTYKTDKFSLSCFDETIHILINGYDGLALGYQG